VIDCSAGAVVASTCSIFSMCREALRLIFRFGGGDLPLWLQSNSVQVCADEQRHAAVE
jgi:hypothetical protein